jgi:hypothetical protein
MPPGPTGIAAPPSAMPHSKLEPASVGGGIDEPSNKPPLEAVLTASI